MNLIDGKYLDGEILAFSGDEKNMWMIVYDGEFNYMLFNTASNENLRKYTQERVPSNNVNRGSNDVEFYSTFDNAMDNLMRVKVNGNKFKPKFLRQVFENE